MKKHGINLSTKEGYGRVLEAFGGQALLQEKYPRILQMLKDSKEMWLSSKPENDAQSNGYQDTCRIFALPVHSSGLLEYGLYAESKMSMVNPYQMLIMTSKTWDPSTKKVFASFSEFGENTQKIKKSTQIDHSYVAYAENLKIETETYFYCIGDVDGKFVLKQNPEVKYLETDLSTSRPIVKKILVSQPKEKKGSDIIRVVYNGRKDPDAAYNFVDAEDWYIENVRYVDVYYPFLIDVELSGDGKTFTFDDEKPVDFNMFYMSLYSEAVKGGEVHFSTSKLDDIEWKLTNNHSLHFDFQYCENGDKNYWGVQMPLTNAQASGYFDFHLNFRINFKDIYGSKYFADIIITSEDLPSSDNMVKIKKSSILWGCIGADAMIQAQEGKKKIQDLSVGEMIYTEQGYKKLVNIVTGTEPEMISISVAGSEKLLLSSKHPIVAERGVIEAGDLAPEDRVRMHDGSYQNIANPERVPYGGTVYSLELETSEMIFANGIMVGDYLTVAETERSEEPQNELTPMDPELRAELLQWMQEFKKKNEPKTRGVLL